MKLQTKVCLGLTFLAAALARTASADVTFGFYAVANNGTNTNTATASQYTVTVSDGGVTGGHNTALFRFENSGPSASSITDIYFQDGTLLASQSIFAASSSAGVEYDILNAANPGHLPGGVGFTPQTTIAAGGMFASTDSNSPAQPKGVNPGEWLTLRFELAGTYTYLDTIAALQTPWPGPGLGALRIGIHVQGFGDGGSESFIDNPVPLPAEATMAGIGMMGMVGVRSVRRRRA